MAGKIVKEGYTGRNIFCKLKTLTVTLAPFCKNADLMA